MALRNTADSVQIAPQTADLLMEPTFNNIVWPCQLTANFKRQLLALAETHSTLTTTPLKQTNVDKVGVSFVLEGIMTAHISAPDSHHLSSCLLGPNDWVGAMALIEKADTIIIAEEIEPVKLLLFPWEKIRQLTEVNLETYKWLYHAAGEMQSKLMQNQFIAKFGRENRVVYTLLDLLAQHPSVTGALPSLRITQAQISLISGMTRPRVNEMLKKLEREGDIALERNSIRILNIEALKGRLASDGLIFRDPRKLIGKLKKTI